MVFVTCAVSNITTPLYVADPNVTGTYPPTTIANRYGYRSLDSGTLCQFLHRLTIPIVVLLPLISSSPDIISRQRHVDRLIYCHKSVFPSRPAGATDSLVERDKPQRRLCHASRDMIGGVLCGEWCLVNAYVLCSGVERFPS